MEKDTELDPHAEGKKLFQRGLIVYFGLAVVGILFGLSIFKSPIGLCVAACFVIAPSQLRKGSEGWKMFTHVFALFLAMSTFIGSCSVVESSTRTIGFFNILVFLMACYLVKIFSYNQKVAAYMAYLRSSGSTHKFR